MYQVFVKFDGQYVRFGRLYKRRDSAINMANRFIDKGSYVWNLNRRQFEVINGMTFEDLLGHGRVPSSLAEKLGI